MTDSIKDRYHRSLPTHELVRLDSLYKGDKFTSAYGQRCVLENRSLKDQGQAFFATDEKGTSLLFCGSALVMLGWHEKGWFQ